MQRLLFRNANLFRLFLLMLCTTFIIFDFLFLRHPLWSKEGQFAVKFVYFLSGVMGYYSYVVASYTKSHVQINRYADSVFDTNHNIILGTCDKCEGVPWKPMRSHHCTVCDKCVLQMDHHCPWIVNCVGVRNKQAYFLFIFYGLTGFVSYQFETIVFFSGYYYHKEDLLKIDPHFFNGPKFYMAVVGYFLSLFFMFFLAQLLLPNIIFSMSNTTAIEKNPSVWCFPEFMRRQNPYDNGALKNLTFYFGNSLAFCWLTRPLNLKYDGYYFDFERNYDSILKVTLDMEAKSKEDYLGLKENPTENAAAKFVFYDQTYENAL